MSVRVTVVRMMIIMVKEAMMITIWVMAEGVDCKGGCYYDDGYRCADGSEDDYRGDGCRDNSSSSDGSDDCDARCPGALAQQAKR